MKPAKLSEKQSHAWHYLESEKFSHVSEVFYGGAAGGGKSFFGCIWQIHRRISLPESVGVIGRKELKSIKESTLVTFFRAAKEYYGFTAGDQFRYNDNSGQVIFQNGSVIYLKELKQMPSDPDFHSLGSVEYTDGFIDELPEITEKAFDMLNSRIRYVKNETHGWNVSPKIYVTGNPGPGWVKNKFVYDNENRPIVLSPHQRFVSATLDDNPDKEFVKIYDTQLSRLSTGYDYKRLRYGDWNIKPAPKNPFITALDKNRHLTTIPVYDPQKQLTISLDFNIDPFGFIFSHHFKTSDGIMHAWYFDEAEIFNGSIPKAVDYIKQYYPQSIPFLRLTGDSGGNRRSIETRDNNSLYRQLANALKLRPNQIMVPSNPTHKSSRADCNYFFHHYPDIQINRLKCPNLCFDLEYVEVDEEGSILKDNRKDKAQRADFLDCMRYNVNTFAKEWILKHQKLKH